MPNYNNKFAMRCTEQQWKRATIDGQDLSGRLMVLGYDLSELKFLPNMPFIATQYKGVQSKIGSTNTPFKEERNVIDEWNADLFYALCCQQDTFGISVGEFFTDKDGVVRECTRVDDKWVVVDYSDGKNDAFPKAKCQKSSYEELVAYYLSAEVPVTANAVQIVGDMLNEAIKKIDKSLLESINEVGSKIIDSAKDISIVATNGEMTSATINSNYKSATLSTTIGPLSFKQILQCFGEGDEVVEGTIEDGEIKCKVHQIDGVSRDSILFVGSEKGVPFSNIYKNKEAFLLHALTTLKSQA